ncbi:putative Tigger transposable elementderived protein 6 [Phytophthora cinnamomi]|uniref:putative Tigger transposable elementderived protein 6 n=1 Tax=Phytophthora cinnamomi TaxID=4785 RepID=UPI00355A42B3|nr:putative Tigger transposable elementderived protein 6 [Phytophthora cinnamomi]
MDEAKREILLLLDNATVHIPPEDTLANVEVEFLPPNTTAAIQPIDQGVIAWIKRRVQRDCGEEAVWRLCCELDPFVIETSDAVAWWGPIFADVRRGHLAVLAHAEGTRSPSVASPWGVTILQPPHRGAENCTVAGWFSPMAPLKSSGVLTSIGMVGSATYEAEVALRWQPTRQYALRPVFR